jgi:glutamate N-acetyltransferase/amino-acid N-acetyltransferase
MAKLTADRLDLDPDQVLVGTTGVIGRYLPMEAVKRGIAEACGGLAPELGEAAARAIMTTDTVPKTHAIELDLEGTTVRVGGMCKGSGMIHPNMATMLAYVTTDAAVPRGWTASVVKRVADRSFNQVTIDGDSSTNDTFLVLANGTAGNRPIEPESPAAEALEQAILDVGRELSRSIARDGEGATKLITVRVSGAPDDAQGRLAARAVASSSLVKAAIHGGDPNWGRIVCALGYSGSELAIDRLTVSIAGLTVFTRGAGVEVDLDAVRRAFEQPEIELQAHLGLGEGTAEAWGCDLSAEYVRINAEYTT